MTIVLREPVFHLPNCTAKSQKDYIGKGNKVSDLRYLDNSTKGEVNTKTPETFEDICDGTYNYYLCIFFNTLYFLFVRCIFYLT